MKKKIILTIISIAVGLIWMVAAAGIIEAVTGIQELKDLNTGQFVVIFLGFIIIAITWLVIIFIHLWREYEFDFLKWLLFILLFLAVFGGGWALGYHYTTNPINSFNLNIVIGVFSVYMITIGSSILPTICFRKDSSLSIKSIVILCFIFWAINQTQMFGFNLIANALVDAGKIDQRSFVLIIFRFFCPQWMAFSVLIACIVKAKFSKTDKPLIFIYALAPIAILLVPVIIALTGTTAIMFAGSSDYANYHYEINGVKAKKIGTGSFEDIKGNKYDNIDESKIIKK